MPRLPRRPRALVSGDVRRHNLTLVLEHIAAAGPSARSEIADATGLTRGAVTALVGALVDGGVLREQQPDAPAGRGRAMARLEIAAPGVAILGASLDADAATAIVTDLAGAELFRVAELHGRPMGEPELVLDVLARVIAEGLDAAAAMGRRVLELPVVVFAPIGGEPPVVIADTDLGWGAVDVLAGLHARLGAATDRTTGSAADASVTLDSDGWLAALAERALLAGDGAVLYLKSNSGIGGAILPVGPALDGARGVGGALGHLPVVPDGVRCACGQRGCLVTVAGPDVLLVRAGLETVVAERGLTAALDEFSARVTAGEPRASAAWNDAVPWIARTIQILSLATAPDAIVIGGYWAAHTASIERAVRENRPTILDVDISLAALAAPPITPGRLGADAALLGAVRIARGRLLADPARLAAPGR